MSQYSFCRHEMKSKNAKWFFVRATFWLWFCFSPPSPTLIWQQNMMRWCLNYTPRWKTRLCERRERRKTYFWIIAKWCASMVLDESEPEEKEGAFFLKQETLLWLCLSRSSWFCFSLLQSLFSSCHRVHLCSWGSRILELQLRSLSFSLSLFHW